MVRSMTTRSSGRTAGGSGRATRFTAAAAAVPDHQPQSPAASSSRGFSIARLHVPRAGKALVPVLPCFLALHWRDASATLHVPSTAGQASSGTSEKPAVAPSHNPAARSATASAPSGRAGSSGGLSWLSHSIMLASNSLLPGWKRQKLEKMVESPKAMARPWPQRAAQASMNAP